MLNLFKNFGEDIKTGVVELAEGKMFPKFQKIPLVAQVRILLKVTAIAVTLGLIANLKIGPFVGALFFVTGGIAAFSYLTLKYQLPEGFLESLKEEPKVVFQADKETVFGQDYEKSQRIQKKFEEKKASRGLAILFNLIEAADLFDEDKYWKAFCQLVP